MPRKTYTEEFKQDAVRLFTEQRLPKARIARDLGITTVTLDSWIKQLAPSHQPEALDESAELARLRKEKHELRMDRDIPKKRRPSSLGTSAEVRLHPMRAQPGLDDHPDVTRAADIAQRLLRQGQKSRRVAGAADSSLQRTRQVGQRNLRVVRAALR